MNNERHSIELIIREILASEGSQEQKIEKICNIVTWDKSALRMALIEFNGYSSKDRGLIIDRMWKKNGKA